MEFFRTRDLSVGYNGRVLIHDISVSLEKGKILTLIGPNGAGKSTILKTITRQLSSIGGSVFYEDRELRRWQSREFARKAAVVLTDRVRPELMNCAEVVAMGRYPHTNLFGRLTPEDQAVVRRCLRRVHGEDLAEQEFATLSDGQRQRIMLARAMCQEPEIIILDEPTAYLDIRHKVELLEILRDMAHREGITVIMSLHEIDLAMKVSDYLLCVKGDTIADFGPPEEVLRRTSVETLYDMTAGSYDTLYGSVELAKPQGDPEAFVVCGAGKGIPVFRALQKASVPFAAGILFENDMDYPAACALAARVISAPAFQPAGEEALRQAEKVLASCKYVIDAGTPVGPCNECNGRLLDFARGRGILVKTGESL